MAFVGVIRSETDYHIIGRKMPDDTAGGPYDQVATVRFCIPALKRRRDGFGITCRRQSKAIVRAALAGNECFAEPDAAPVLPLKRGRSQ